MSIVLRRFNSLGVDEFRKTIHNIKAGVGSTDVGALTQNPEFTSVVLESIKLSEKIFTRKDELIRYLLSIVDDAKIENSLYDRGLWTWLSAFYFESVCPRRQDGSRKVGDDNRYILSPDEWNRYYRHLLASPVRLLKELGTAAEIYLSGKPDVHGDLFEQLASRQEIAASRGVIEAVTILYWDSEKSRIKKGARNTDGPGILRRLVKSVIPQFQMTFDLNSMTGKDITNLLPDEFNSWIPSK